MATRMQCAACGALDFADTWIEGSDRLEGMAWLLGGWPGWLYCAWRHALRGKRCARCGSGELLRETRASRERSPWPLEVPGCALGSRQGTAAAAWPAPLREPRQRLWSGLPWLGAWCLAGLGLLLPGGLVGLAFLAWIVRKLRATDPPDPAQAEGPRLPCAAWDASGRALRVEWVQALR